MRMWLRIPCSESRASFAISFVTRLLKVNYLSQAAVLKRKGWGEGSNTPSGVSRWKQLSSASLIRPFLPMLGFLLLLWEECQCWQWWMCGWLDFPSSPDEEVPLLATAWGCLWALDMKLERGEGGAHAMGSYLWDDSVDGEAANWWLHLSHVSMVFPSHLFPAMSNKLKQIGMRDYQALNDATEPSLPLCSLWQISIFSQGLTAIQTEAGWGGGWWRVCACVKQLGLLQVSWLVSQLRSGPVSVEAISYLSVGVGSSL